MDFVPVGGANSASALISLYLGLSLKFVFLLDSDEAGQKAKKRYLDHLPMSENRVIQIGDVFKSPRIIAIEDLISENMKSVIKQKYEASRISKKHILRAFSEALSGVNDLPNDQETLCNLKMLVEELHSRLQHM